MKRTLLATLIVTTCTLSYGTPQALATSVTEINDPAQIQATQKWRYSIQISSTATLEQPDPKLGTLNLGPRLIYIMRSKAKDHTWYRMRLGFFETYQQAQKVLDQLGPLYKGAWIIDIDAKEKEDLLAGDFKTYLLSASGSTTVIRRQRPTPNTDVPQALSPAPAGRLLKVASHDNETTPAEKTSPDTPPKTESGTDAAALTDEEKRLQSLMERGRQAMVDKQYNRAIELYNNVLREGETQFSPQALEFMGLAQERKGLTARALRSYRQYLERYGEHEGAPRVKQRRDALVTAATPPKQQLRARQQVTEPQWTFYGGVSQFYRRDENTTELDDEEETTVTRSSLSNDMYLTGRYRGETYDMRTRFAGGYEADFLESDESEFRMSTLYLDTQHRESGHSLRFGRQSESKGGVLGRFDGFTYGHFINDQLRINVVGGFPVESSTVEEINTDLYFYGINADLGTFADAWDYNLFYIEQYNSDVLDRRAIGGEVRYFQDGKTLFSLLDYDISYDELNTFLLLGSWTNLDNQTFNISLNYRNSPILTTNNAIQSQGVNDLSELLATGITEDEARELAEDRTARSRSVTLGMVQPIDDQFQLSGDITISDLGDTPASGGVEAIEGTDTEVSYFLQGIGSDLLKDGDIAIVGLRYSDLTNSQRYALSLNTRYPVTNELRINPRLQMEYRVNERDDTDQWFVRPSFRLDYRWTRQARFELEMGGEFSSRELTDDTSETRGYYIVFGYRYDF